LIAGRPTHGRRPPALEPERPSLEPERPSLEPERIAALVERSPLLIGLIDDLGAPCYLSPAATALLAGSDGSDIIGAADDAARMVRIHPDDVELVVHAYETARDHPEQGPVTFCARTRHDDGTWRHFEGEFANQLDDPEVRGVLLSIKDVTDRVRVEDELRRQLAAEAMLADIARDLLRGADERFDDIISSALDELAHLFDASRAAIFFAEGDELVRRFAWCAPGAVSPPVDRLPMSSLDQWSGRNSDGHASAIDACTSRRVNRGLGAIPGVSESVLAVALLTRDRPLGFVSFGHDEADHVWSSGARECAEQFAVLLTTVLERRNAEAMQRQSLAVMEGNAARFSRLVEHSPDVVIVLDTEGHISFASPAARSVFGYEPEEIVGRTPWDLVHPDDLETAIDAFARAVENFQPELVPIRISHKDGTWIPVETIGSPLFDDPVVAGLLVNIRDVRERERMTAELRDMEARFQQAWKHAPIGMGFAARDGAFADVNPALCEMLGYTEAELRATSTIDLTHPDDLAKNLELHEALYRGDIPRYSHEKRFRHKDGTWRWTRVTVTPIRDRDGRPIASLGQVEDITERKKFEERLAYEATHDGLTGLPLRKLLLDHLDLALSAARRVGSHVGVLFIDLDHFKRINDSLGHAAGDTVLIEVAERLRWCLRDGDTPGRFGGDEFVIVCPALDDPRDIVQVADRLLERLAEPFVVEGVEVYAGASIGIAVAEPGVDAETLLRQADTAAYRAKDHGRNRYEIFDAELRASVLARLQTEMALRRALENDELLVLYQPIVTAVTGELVGYEALVRWDRPGYGRLSPAEFLEVAEDTGLIVPLGRFVLNAACAQLAAWQRQRPDHPPFVAVNLSPRQLLSPELVDDVQDAITSSGATAELVWLELPETLLVHDTPQLVSLLDKLRDLGVHIALDDFGTGFSSLTHLRFLPVGVVKIDRSFIFELGRSNQGTTIVGAVISLAHALGMRVVAEGVETVEQLEILRSLNCDWVQGFYFATPLLSGHATQVMASGRLRA
jgi:diguanylate cyclase (GGDEF)-like protein/PAS domain S-box-containing protein